MDSQLKFGPRPRFTIKTDQYFAFMIFMLLVAILAVDMLWSSLPDGSTKVFPVVLVGMAYCFLATELWRRRGDQV